jgi:diguanylate cyclase (GGDEF)-like protein
VGGEEFAVLLVDAPTTAAAAFGRRALEATRRLAIAGGIRLTASAGVASAPTDADSVDELLRLADDRLLQATARGKNRVQVDS